MWDESAQVPADQASDVSAGLEPNDVVGGDRGSSRQVQPEDEAADTGTCEEEGGSTGSYIHHGCLPKNGRHSRSYGKTIAISRFGHRVPKFTQLC